MVQPLYETPNILTHSLSFSSLSRRSLCMWDARETFYTREYEGIREKGAERLSVLC